MKRLFLIAIFVGLACPLSTHARPAHKQALAQYFGPFLPKKLNDCRTCHLPEKSGYPKEEEDYEKPHNAFGARLKAVKEELRKVGKKTTLDARLDAILKEDTDGDGSSNLIEILTGHNPGDKDDRPSAADLADAKKLVAAFAKFHDGYPWRPFEVVKRPTLPPVKDQAWARNPIDTFIAAEHEANGLKPRPEAPKAILLRRLYLDLTGLPPLPEELHAFLKDTSPDPYEMVVDRLLASPRYGERWGRHWMDVWRYSDWAGWGQQVRDSQPHIWHWRDWIVDSLNADKGYDRMILEMLAGDELAPEDPQALAGTGYLVRNWKLLSREKWLQDTVEHTFMAFQGMTIGCAKCHDHMYDPILQKDYYQVRAIFEPHNVRTDQLPGKPDLKIDGLPRVYDKDIAAATYLFIRGDDRTPDKSKPIVPAVPEALGGRFPKIEPVSLPRGAVHPDKRAFVLREIVEESTRQLAMAKEELDKAKEKDLPQLKVKWKEAAHQAILKILEAEKLEDANQKGMEVWKKVALETQAAQRQANLGEARLNAGLAEEKLKVLAAKKPDVAAKKDLEAKKKALDQAEKESLKPLDGNYKPRTLTAYPAQSSGRRLALAKWLADRDNPLTARVAVNHIWLRHFGQALVPSTFDFGRNGHPPSHPALLDWLAAELMEPSLPSPRGGEGPGARGKPWSMKHVHRLIVTSQTYRLASTPDAANTALDRDNKYLWRYPPHPVESEVVRDCIFFVAGRLDLTMGGPEIDFPLGLTVPRRSLYFCHAAEKQMEFMQIFDGPSVTECYERKQAIVPGQALALFNSDLTLASARILARVIAVKEKAPAPFITAAFERVLSRPPSPAELLECNAFLKDQAQQFKTAKAPGATGLSIDGRLPAPDPELRARENLVHVLMNHHEFVTVR